MKQRRTKEQLIFDLNVYAETENWYGAIKDILEYHDQFRYDDFLSKYLTENNPKFTRKLKRKMRKIR